MPPSLQVDNIFTFIRQVALLFPHNNIFVFIHPVAVLFPHNNIFIFNRQVAPVSAYWLFKTSATS